MFDNVLIYHCWLQKEVLTKMCDFTNTHLFDDKHGNGMREDRVLKLFRPLIGSLQMLSRWIMIVLHAVLFKQDHETLQTF